MTQKTTWKLNRYQKLKKKKDLEQMERSLYIKTYRTKFFLLRQQTDDTCLFHCSETLIKFTIQEKG